MPGRLTVCESLELGLDGGREMRIFDDRIHRRLGGELSIELGEQDRIDISLDGQGTEGKSGR